MLIVVFLYLTVTDGGIDQLVYNLAFVSIGQEVVLVLLEFTRKIILDVLLGLGQNDSLTNPLLNVVSDNGHAVLGRQSGRHQTLDIAAMKFKVIDLGHHRRIVACVRRAGRRHQGQCHQYYGCPSVRT